MHAVEQTDDGRTRVLQLQQDGLPYQRQRNKQHMGRRQQRPAPTDHQNMSVEPAESGQGQTNINRDFEVPRECTLLLYVASEQIEHRIQSS